MKFLFVLRHMVYFRFFEGAIRELAAQGHTVHVTFSKDVSKKGATVSDRAILQCARDYPDRITYGENEDVTAQTGAVRYLKYMLRHLAGYTIYLDQEYQPRSPILMTRWRGSFPPKTRWLTGTRPMMWLLSRRWARPMLQWFERRLPVKASLVAWLDSFRPDVVIASPYVQTDPEEVEYIKAAKKLKIPTVVAVASWDNLTNKGTFADVPDRVLVWNEGLADEAVRIHRIPRKRIIITGAAAFDTWFEMQPSRERAAFCGQLGIDPTQPYITYLCSSWFISKDETVFVDKLVQALQANPATQHVNLVVRPHPLHLAPWADYPDTAHVVVFPRDGQMPDVAADRQLYFDTLYHSCAVIGVNTSAFIEAAIVDRPCLTLLDEHYQATQAQIPHFHHLMDAGFLETRYTLPDFIALVATIAEGVDAKAALRRQFVEAFVRPHGRDKSVAPIMAAAIADVAKPSPIQ